MARYIPPNTFTPVRMLSVCNPLNLFVVGGRSFFQYGDSVRSQMFFLLTIEFSLIN